MRFVNRYYFLVKYFIAVFLLLVAFVFFRFANFGHSFNWTANLMTNIDLILGFLSVEHVQIFVLAKTFAVVLVILALLSMLSTKKSVFLKKVTLVTYPLLLLLLILGIF